MATLKAELREILTKYGIDPQDKSKLWDCHGTLVLYHRAYEIIAARERITFDAPVIIEARSADKIVALLVTGRMGDRAEWSIGEAAPGNCKNAYVYAIAEKRAKDRVVAKLVGLAEYVYSEDEADEFKEGPRAAPVPASARYVPPTSQAPATGTAPQATRAAPLPVNPEEPPEVAQQRAAARAEFWKRDSYAIDPEIVSGGMAAWDREVLALAETAPNLDAFLKLRDENEKHFYAWAKSAARPVVDSFSQRLDRAYQRVATAEGVAA